MADDAAGSAEQIVGGVDSGLLPAKGAPHVEGKAYVASTVDGYDCEPVGDTLIRTAAARGELVALTWLTDGGAARMTWSELLERSLATAGALTSYVRQGDRAVLMAPNSVSWIVANYACALSGVTIVPISPTSTSSEIEHVVRQVDAQLVLAVEERDGVRVHDRVHSALSTLPNPPAVLDIGEMTAVSPAADFAPRSVAVDDEYLIQHTSGTTGKPKAALLTHRAALGSADYFVTALHASAEDIWFNPLPLYHVGASVAGVLGALATASAFVVMDRFSAAGAVEVITRLEPTVIGVVPTMVIDLLGLDDVGPETFSTVRAVVGGATTIDPRVIDRLERELGLRFLVAYGQSEAPCTTMSSDRDPTEVRISTLGRPLAGRDVCIADESGTLADVGVIGELCVRGAVITSGYVKPGGELVSASGEHGWMHTGDLCSLDAEGVLRFHARRREVIIRGGSNIYPAEVEAVISSHHAVLEVAVFGVPDARLGEAVAAAVIVEPGAETSAEDLTEFCAGLISTSKVPQQWHFVRDMPRTSTGKVRKHLLPGSVS